MPVWAVIFAAIVFQAVQAAGIATIIRTPYNAQWARYGFCLLFFFILFLCLNGERWRLLYHYIFIIDFEITAKGISQVFDALIFTRPRQQSDALFTAIVTLILFTAGIPLVLHLIKKLNISTSGIHAPFFWRTVWLLPTINTLIVLMNTNLSTRDDLLRPQYLTSRLLLFVSMYLVYIILMRVLEVIRREAVLRERAEKQEEILAAERARQEQLERYAQEMNRVKHDNLQHMRVMNSFIENGEYESLKNYMAQYEASIPKRSPKKWCASQTANILLSYYAEIFQSRGIGFDVKADLPEKTTFSEPDICSILGNLLENALAACIKVPELQPMVKLRAKADKDELILTLDNTCEGPPQMEGEVFLSTKHGGFGIGTASIRSTAEKYHGRAEFRYEDHMFYASVLLFAPV